MNKQNSALSQLVCRIKNNYGFVVLEIFFSKIFINYSLIIAMLSSYPAHIPGPTQLERYFFFSFIVLKFRVYHI